jgi:hypothetical protein
MAYGPCLNYNGELWLVKTFFRSGRATKFQLVPFGLTDICLEFFIARGVLNALCELRRLCDMELLRIEMTLDFED